MEIQEWSEEWRMQMIPKIVPGGKTRTQDRTVPAQQTDTNNTNKNKKMTQGKEGGSNPIQNKCWTKKKSRCGATQGPPCIEQAPRGMTEQVRAEGIRTDT
jgi:hypothetical protein